MKDINFPCMSYTIDELCGLSLRIFKENNYLQSVKLTEDKALAIIKGIANEYNVTAYHTFTHGFSIFQLFYAVMVKTDLNHYLTDLEKVASLLACLGHDSGHRGYNNFYYGKLKTKLSYAYYDSGIQENMHASLLLKVLEKPNIKLLDNIDNPKAKAEFRELIITSILATDMSRHNRLLQKFVDRVRATVELRKMRKNNQTPTKEQEEKAYNLTTFDDKKRVIKNLVHACDIGNPCLKFENYAYWAALITQEFNNQALKEEKRGVPVSTFLKYKDPAGFYGGQMFFTKTFVLPLWEQINVLFEGIEETYANLQNNIKRCEEEKEKYERENKVQ